MSQKPSERYGEEIQTERWKLYSTGGTKTDYSLVDKSAGSMWQFDKVWVGSGIGRGDEVQLMTVEDGDKTPVGNIYQHQFSNYMIKCLKHMDEHGKIPEPDYQDPEVFEE